jgi:hypothetical protein
MKSNPLVYNTQKILSNNHINDTKGLFNTRQTGIYNPLRLGIPKTTNFGYSKIST